MSHEPPLYRGTERSEGLLTEFRREVGHMQHDARVDEDLAEQGLLIAFNWPGGPGWADIFLLLKSLSLESISPTFSCSHLERFEEPTRSSRATELSDLPTAQRRRTTARRLYFLLAV
jgi:hypothetical protein